MAMIMTENLQFLNDIQPFYYWQALGGASGHGFKTHWVSMNLDGIDHDREPSLF